jgi:hypothetical protein
MFSDNVLIVSLSAQSSEMLSNALERQAIKLVWCAVIDIATKYELSVRCGQGR